MVGSIGPRMQAITLPHVSAWNVWWSDYGNTAAGFADVKATVDERIAAIGRTGEIEATAAVHVKLPGGSGRQMGDYPTDGGAPIEGSPSETRRSAAASSPMPAPPTCSWSSTRSCRPASSRSATCSALLR